MSDSPAREFRGIVYRQCEPDHTDLDVTLEHNRQRGGRFSPREEFGVIYVTEERETALQELARHAAFIGLTLSECLPRTMLRLRLHVRQLLDLTDAAICHAWGLSTSEMATTTHEQCQEIARAAYRAGYEAIRFRSATGGGVCLAVFKDRLSPGSYLEIEDTELVPAVDSHI